MTERPSETDGPAADPAEGRPTRVDFGPFRYDRSRVVLLRNDEEVALPPRVLALLEILVDRPHEVVSKEELLDAVWEGRIVGEESLPQAISVLRQALGDDPQRPTYVRTVPRRGYLWLAPPAEGVGSETGEKGESATSRSEPWRSVTALGFRAALGILVLALLGVLAVTAARMLLTDSSRPDRAEDTLPSSETATGGDLPMVAVLGFENLGTIEDAYFATGMGEEILGRLGSVPEIVAISARWVKSTAELDDGIEYLLEGGVRVAIDPRGRKRVRITPRLLRRDDHTLLWSEVYDREIEDVFAVQSEIATKVLAALGVRLAEGERAAPGAPPTAVPEAYEAYLRGRQSASMLGDYGIAAGHYRRAIELDPDFAHAWAELANVKGDRYRRGVERTSEDLALLRRAVRRATELAPEDPRVRLARARNAREVEQDAELGLAIYRSLLEDYPRLPSVHTGLGSAYLNFGRPALAVRHFERARLLEPQRAGASGILADLYRGLRRFDASVEQWNRTIALEPNDALAHARRAETRLARGDDPDVIRGLLEAAPEGYEVSVLSIGLDLSSGGYDRAVARARGLLEDTSSLEGPWQEVAIRLQIGLALRLAGDDAAAQLELGTLQERLSALLASQPDSVTYRRSAAEVAALQGRETVALDLARSAIAQQSEHLWFRPVWEQTLAFVLAWTGHEDEALDLLERLLEERYWRALTPALLAVGAGWTPLHDEPRFRELTAASTN